MECSDPSSLVPMNGILSQPCNSTYLSMCELQCLEGFNGTGDPWYKCDISESGFSVKWRSVGNETWNCSKGMYMYMYIYIYIYIYMCVCVHKLCTHT